MRRCILAAPPIANPGDDTWEVRVKAARALVKPGEAQAHCDQNRFHALKGGGARRSAIGRH